MILIPNLKKCIQRSLMPNKAILRSFLTTSISSSLYRKLDNTINPDLEITKYLTEKTEYKNSPRFVGAIEYTPDTKNIIVLGMMQDLVPNQGDAWDYTKDALNRFFEQGTYLSQRTALEEETEHTLSPCRYQELSEHMKELMGVVFPERMFLLGQTNCRNAQSFGCKSQLRKILNRNLFPCTTRRSLILLACSHSQEMHSRTFRRA